MKPRETITHEGIEAKLVLDQRCFECCFYELKCPKYSNGDLMCIDFDSDDYGTFKKLNP